MRWLQTEYVLKGIFLGLLLFVALESSSAPATAGVGLATLGGLVVALMLAASAKFRAGYRVKGRWLTFMLFLLLESPTLVYGGIIVGTALGAFIYVTNADNRQVLAACVGGGAVLGAVFSLIRRVKVARIRLAA